MNLKMKTLAAAMIAAGSMASAQAAEVLFPYVVNSSTVTTVVSVIYTGFQDPALPQQLHYRLWYKDGANAENNAANCVETNVMRSTSYLDIQTIDLGGKFGASTLGVLFNDPSIKNNWKANNQSFALASFAEKPMRGWLIVEDEYIQNFGTYPAGALQGEAMVFEFGSGAAWGYQAGVSDYQNFGSDFSAGNDLTPNIAFGGNNAQAFVNFAPFGETETKFFVTPIVATTTVGGLGMVNAAGNNNDNATGLTQDGYRLSLGDNAFAIVDRDENILSGSTPRDVTCVGSISARTLISGATLAQVPNGGWSILVGNNRGVGLGGKDITDAAVIKLDYNTKGTFNGETTPGVYNNAFVLKALNN